MLDRKRLSIPGTSRISSLADITMYTTDEDASSSVVYMVMSAKLLMRLVPGMLKRLRSNMDSTTRLERLVTSMRYRPGLPANLVCTAYW